jgi:hypothetical protein
MRKRFFLNITPDEIQRYYRGEATTVVVTGEDRTRLQFPAQSLRQFVTENGVSGYFEIEYDEFSRLVGISRLS